MYSNPPHRYGAHIGRVVVVADPHAGKNWRGVSEDDWLMPMFEPLSTMKNNDILVISGDVFHHPNPKVLVIDRFYELFGYKGNGASYGKIFAAGNHDLLRPRTTNALGILKASRAFLPSDKIYGCYNERNYFDIHQFANMSIGVINWPTLELFDKRIDRTEPLREQLKQAAGIILEDIQDAMKLAEIEQLDLLVGHAHTYTPSESGEYPEHLAGRDILLPDTALKAIAKHCALGHIHIPSEMYVGSTQPTDLSDTSTKRWVEWVEGEMISHDYKNSINVVEVKLSSPGNDELASVHLNYLPDPKRVINILRLVLDMEKSDSSVTAVETTLLQKQLRQEAKWDDVEIVIIPPARKVRHETEKDESLMTPAETVLEYSGAFIDTAQASDVAKGRAKDVISNALYGSDPTSS